MQFGHAGGFFNLEVLVPITVIVCAILQLGGLLTC